MTVVGEIEGKPVTYDKESYEFSVEINGETFKAKSFPSLKKLVEQSKTYEWITVMRLSYSNQAPSKIKVTKRGSGYYELYDGKLHRAESYYLYEMDEEKFKQLTELCEQIESLGDQYEAVKNKLKQVAW